MHGFGLLRTLVVESHGGITLATLRDVNLDKRCVAFFFFYSSINIYNISYIKLYLSNYFTTLQVRYHGERKTMTTPWPI